MANFQLLKAEALPELVAGLKALGTESQQVQEVPKAQVVVPQSAAVYGTMFLAFEEVKLAVLRMSLMMIVMAVLYGVTVMVLLNKLR